MTQPLTVASLRAYLNQLSPADDQKPVRAELDGGHVVQLLDTVMGPSANADELWVEAETYLEPGFVSRQREADIRSVPSRPSIEVDDEVYFGGEL